MLQHEYLFDYARKSNRELLEDSLTRELRSYRDKGVALSIKGRSVNPEEVALVCALCENKAHYMRDYITDDNGIVRKIEFTRIN